MTTRKKKRQQDNGGFLKKVSSLFNLDTVIFFSALVLHCVSIYRAKLNTGELGNLSYYLFKNL